LSAERGDTLAERDMLTAALQSFHDGLAPMRELESLK
jgi:hypothetical protein